MKTAGWLAMAVQLAAAGASAASTIDATNHYAWGANVGWVDAFADGTNGAVVGQFVCAGYLYAPSIGWINLGNGSPTNGYCYANAGRADFGVNLLEGGNLRGYAWSDSVGWVAFEDVGAPAVDLLAGTLSGSAWGANVGWISFSNGQAFVQTDRLDAGPDANTNGIPDQWELAKVGSLALLARNGHYGGKAMTDYEQYVADTDPNNSNDVLAITALTNAGATNSWVTWASKPTRLYRINQAGALTNAALWADSGLGLLSPDPVTTTTRLVTHATATQRFFRVSVMLPLGH